MMFAKLFRSRWSALMWAGGILWTAVDVAGSSPAPAPASAKPSAASEDATGAAATASDLAALANAGLSE